MHYKKSTLTTYLRSEQTKLEQHRKHKQRYRPDNQHDNLCVAHFTYFQFQIFFFF